MFSMLDKAGIKFEKHFNIIGKPDIAFPEHKIAIFIDGEFWHGKDFRVIQASLSPFWVKKIGENLKRDKKNVKVLKKEGWRVLRLWDKAVIKFPQRSLRRITRLLEQTQLPSTE